MAKTHKQRKQYSNTYSNPSLKGGKVLGSGGFGCIFRPALKCKSRTASKNVGDQITKLMKRKYAIKEKLEVLKFNKLLKNIPNYSNYFLIDGFSVCEPSPLTAEDLENFDEKCSALKKINLDKENINRRESLQELLALNMPYGGVDVSKFIDEHWHNAKKMEELNNSMIQLLESGIVPMNAAGVYHCDLKSSNILAREEDGVLRSRLIDWGLSTAYQPGQTIPKVLTNRPFQYNVPFSNILFTSLFTKMYKSFLAKHPNPDYYTLRTFVINYVLEWVEERGPGHLKTMNNIFKNLFEQDLKHMEDSFRGELIEYDFTFYFIFEYITKILVAFTRNGKFDNEAYLNQVFLKNIDVWGFVVSYVPIVEDVLGAHKKLTTVQFNIIDKIKELMLMLIDASDHAVNIPILVEKLNSLNTLFSHFKRAKKPESSPSSSTSLPKKELLDELNLTEKKALSAGSLSSRTRKKLKKRRFHKMIVKTLKNIKSLHSKRAWI
jgi:serine/threonine protein kinase